MAAGQLPRLTDHWSVN